MNTRRLRPAFVVGLAVFGVGMAVALYFGLRSEEAGVDLGPTTEVLTAGRTIPSGTTGSNAVAQGLVVKRAIPQAAVPEGALTDVSQLAGKVTVVPVPAGQILVQAQFPDAQTRIGTLRIPDGKTALALLLENVPGVAGFAGAGDRINVYGVVRLAEGGTSSVRLVMQGIEVLNVNGTTLVPTQGQPGGSGLVFLLAVTPAEAEQLIYLSSFERLYFSLTAEGQFPVPSTPGAGATDALRVG